MIHAEYAIIAIAYPWLGQDVVSFHHMRSQVPPEIVVLKPYAAECVILYEVI